ncbi:MAG: hypothetical protein H0T50_06930, partial [Gemmatimonadales bacterium]|nr:hypothetical protein [Gemmatimonadales bacterium]
YFSQMNQLAFHNFVSAAVGMAYIRQSRAKLRVPRVAREGGAYDDGLPAQIVKSYRPGCGRDIHG